jgi:iron complex outermembrane receptor protein
MINSALAQQASSTTTLPEIDVNAPHKRIRQTTHATTHTPAESTGDAANVQYHTTDANLGPLGNKSIQDTPASVTVVPQDLIVNQQVKTVNDTLRFLPSVEIRDQQGFEVSRPQARGFQGSIVQNTRLDGLNIIGTTAIPAENLSGIQVLNGLAGSLYGPAPPAGVFNYTLARPTDSPLTRYTQGYDSSGVYTEHADLGGRSQDGKVGYRFNVLHGEGESWVSGSDVIRTLASGAFDFHIDDRTVIETDFSHYSAAGFGLPGSFVYDSGKSTILPKAVDPTRVGYGQPGAGTDLITNTGLVKVKHEFNNDWNIEIGGLYQDAVRNLFGITNTMTDDIGNFSVTKNFNAVPHFTIGSNLASLNGHFDLFGFRNDVTIGTNGFINGQYTYRNSIATVLGKSNLANPVVLPQQPIPPNGGEFKSAELSQQNIVTGDTWHFNDQLAVQAVLGTSFLRSKSFSANGKMTSSDTENGLLSPTVSLIYKPIPALTTYVTYADTVEQGEQAPAGTANVNQVLAPYRDKQYEIGAKYAVSKSLLLTIAGFQMTRPLAITDPSTNVFQVVGTQRNTGVEAFAQGAVTPDLSIFGGVTYIDARLVGTGNAATNGKLVVGVPEVKSDVALDYHPAFAHGVAFTGAVHYESRRAATNINNSFAPSYATLDLGVRYSTVFQKHTATFRFQVNNVTNTNYYVSIADGNIVGSPGANTAYLGTPRVYMASVQMDF